MNNSIMFSANMAESLNTLAVEKVDVRLYVFAYYCPKPMPDEDESFCFWLGVMNIYNLFFDCAPFLHKKPKSKSVYRLLDAFERNGLINRSENEFMTDFIRLINSLRTLFCHNATAQNNGNFAKLKDAETFFGQFSPVQGILNDNNNIGYLRLTPNEWNECAKSICYSAEQCMVLIQQVIMSLEVHPQKADIVNDWLNGIAVWYQINSEFFKSVIADYYDWQMQNNKHNSFREKCLDNWENNYKQIWKADIANCVWGMTNQALPYETMFQLVTKLGLKAY